MKRYASVKGNSRLLFKNKEDAINHTKEFSDRVFEEYDEWSYYKANLRNSITSYVSIFGDSIAEAIEASFEGIAETLGLGFYTLDKVVLLDNKDGTATLNISAWTTNSNKVGFEESMLSEENKKKFTLEINGIVDGDIQNGKIEFKIRERIG